MKNKSKKNIPLLLSLPVLVVPVKLRQLFFLSLAEMPASIAALTTTHEE